MTLSPPSPPSSRSSPSDSPDARAAAATGDRLLVVVGPTASGKTDLAVRLAEQLGGEIISADSVQIYRRFDVGSGKPTPEQGERAPHHLVGSVDPLESVDAATWAAAAEPLIFEVRRRGRVPIVCGGTFLWVRALVYGLAGAPPGDERIRQRHREKVEKLGRGSLHEELSVVDPKAAARLAPNDFVRVSRALEVYELTGIPMSEWQDKHGFRVQRYRARLIGVAHDREALHARIGQRVGAMLDAGWIEEVEALLGDGYAEARAMKAVGYRHIAEALLSGRVVRSELREKIAQATRVFARRQRTWLRDEAVEWLLPHAAFEPDTEGSFRLFPEGKRSIEP